MLKPIIRAFLQLNLPLTKITSVMTIAKNVCVLCTWFTEFNVIKIRCVEMGNCVENVGNSFQIYSFLPIECGIRFRKIQIHMELCISVLKSRYFFFLLFVFGMVSKRQATILKQTSLSVWLLRS